jgi:regulator of protease activity HflC (stomatin/prohibitin superfamily)
VELLIALAVIAVFVIIVVVRSIKIVPQAQAAVVERPRSTSGNR